MFSFGIVACCENSPCCQIVWYVSYSGILRKPWSRDLGHATFMEDHLPKMGRCNLLHSDCLKLRPDAQLRH